ncbi:hypothetical protein [Pararhizobium sp.]|uniref:hypothetical protein n=1 Tax=Pararhizobium sp. TaxID=1977563 RepID=UPI003D0BAE30
MAELVEAVESDLRSDEELGALLETASNQLDQPDPGNAEPPGDDGKPPLQVKTVRDPNAEPEPEQDPPEQEPPPASTPDPAQPPTDPPPSDPPPATDPPPHDEALKNQRARIVELKRMLTERDEQLKDFQERQQRIADNQTPTPSQDEYSVEELVGYVADADAGKNDGQYRNQAMSHLVNRNPEELLGVMEKARAGTYGELSPDVEQLGRNILVEAQAKWGKTQERQKQVDEATRVRKESQAFVDGFEGMHDEEGNPTEMFERYHERGKELLQLIPSLAYEPRAPQRALEYMQLVDKADAFDTLNQQTQKLQAENDELKRRLGLTESPASGSDDGTTPQNSGGQKTLSAQDEAREDLESKLRADGAMI